MLLVVREWASLVFNVETRAVVNLVILIGGKVDVTMGHSRGHVGGQSCDQMEFMVG